MKIINKLIVCFLCVVMLSALVSCGDTKSEGTNVGATKYGQINGGKPITLNVEINNYMPSLNETPTDQSPIVFRSIQHIADEFTKMFPNVKIEWDRTKASVGNWSQWMTTQVSAGTAPEIVMLHGAEYADRGWFVRLNEELEKPNVFVDNNKKWKDMFPTYMWDSSMTTDVLGNIVAVPYVAYPGVATAYFYNKEIFKKLNLSIPKTWEEFINTSKKINQANYIAVGPWSLNKQINVNLWDIQFSLGPTYAEKIKDKWDYNKDGKMTPNELLRAEFQGVFYAKNNPAVLDIYNQIKRKYTEVLQDGAENTDYEALWVEGKVAMMEDGLWRIPTEKANTKRKFEYGIFTAPVADETTSQYASNIEYNDGPFQPPIAESYNIVKSAVDKKGPGAKEAALKFLQWITKPENLDQVILEKHGEAIGAVKNTMIPPELNDWFKGKFPKLPKATWVTGPTVSSQSRMSKQLEMWVKGMITDKEFTENYDKELEKGVNEQIKSFGIDTSSWK